MVASTVVRRCCVTFVSRISHVTILNAGADGSRRHLPAMSTRRVTRRSLRLSSSSNGISKAGKPLRNEPELVHPDDDDVKPRGVQYYLLKSEPESRIDPRTGQDMKFSIEDLMKQEDQTASWDGVRNYQARNVMREMRLGDLGFFYHSSCKEPGIVGIVEVVREAYPDHTQFLPEDSHFDPKSTKENPRWDMVDVKLVRPLRRKISLDELKRYRDASGPLSEMALFRSGRLSVQPVRKKEFDFILQREEDNET